MRITGLAIVLLLAACTARAGGLDLNKDAVTASPPDPQGAALIEGPPGCVAGFPPVYLSARNKSTGTPVNAQVSPDGSFAVRVPAAPGDSVKLSFFSRNGKSRDMTVRIPREAAGVAAGAPGRERAEVNVDLSPFAPFGAPEVVQVKPDGRGGTRVHVGRRPRPVPTPPSTPSPSVTPDAEGAPDPTPATAGDAAAPVGSPIPAGGRDAPGGPAQP